MTAAQLRDSLLPMLGVEAIGDAPPEAATRILYDLNSVLREIYAQAPEPWIGVSPRGDLIRAPTTVTITTTADSKTVTFAGYATWMAGCSIQIEGDATINKLTNDVSAGVSLVLPYDGTSGSHSATVYHDSINLDSSVVSVLSPVMLEDQWELLPMNERDRMNSQVFGRYHGGDHGIRPNVFPLLARDKRVTRPQAYSMGEPNMTFNGDVTQRMVLDTFPDTRYRMSYQAKTFLSVTDLSADARTNFLPFGHDFSILRPWLRYRFATWPDSRMSQDELQGEFDAALSMLQGMTGPRFEISQVSIEGGW